VVYCSDFEFQSRAAFVIAIVVEPSSIAANTTISSSSVTQITIAKSCRAGCR